MPMLPANPSAEHLRKDAKRLARRRSLRLAQAQRLLANDYGFRTWPALMRAVARRSGAHAALPPIFAAVRAGDINTVGRLLESGANPRVGDGRETPLHLAARRGSLALVKALIAGGALEWQPNAAGETALDVAKRSRRRERAEIVALLDRRIITDRSFCAAVDAIHAGEADELARLLDAEPRLLRERIFGPDLYRTVRRHQYFLDPKLFWFIANNPKLVDRMPSNMTELAGVMIERGVEQSDLDYTLELTMTSSGAREAGQQQPLMRVLLAAGACATRDAIVTTAAYGEIDALRGLLAAGEPMDAPIAASIGDDEALRRILPSADRADVQTAFALAVINANVEAARLAIAAGADVNVFLPVHAHSTPLHQAAIGDERLLIELLLEHGARTDIRDTLWDGTPLDWAIHEKRSVAQSVLRAYAGRLRPDTTLSER